MTGIQVLFGVVRVLFFSALQILQQLCRQPLFLTILWFLKNFGMNLLWINCVCLQNDKDYNKTCLFWRPAPLHTFFCSMNSTAASVDSSNAIRTIQSDLDTFLVLNTGFLIFCKCRRHLSVCWTMKKVWLVAVCLECVFVFVFLKKLLSHPVRLVMQGGFAMLETGFIQAARARNILFKVRLLVFLFFGFF